MINNQQIEKTEGTNIVRNNDCLAVLSQMPSNMVDLTCTDPPYQCGYSFMGKDWDKAVPSVEIWKEVLRVMKPGAFCFVMRAPRQDVLSQMIVRLGQAGFNTGFTSIYWTYACLSADTEVLTENGWVNGYNMLISNHTNDKILVYDTNTETYKLPHGKLKNMWLLLNDGNVYELVRKKLNVVLSKQVRQKTIHIQPEWTEISESINR